MTKNNDIHLVFSITENWIEKAIPYLDSVQRNISKQIDCVCFTVEFDADFDLRQNYPDICFVKMTDDQNKGAPEGTKSIQHGSFLRMFSNVERIDVFLFSDCDIIIQRPFTDEELDLLDELQEGQVFVGWNSGDGETLLDEGLRLQPRVYAGELLRRWGPTEIANPCFNIGVIAAGGTTWNKIYERYMERWGQASELFGHRARQQWLVCYVMGLLGVEVIPMPHTFHTHGHYGLPLGLYLDEDMRAVVDDKVVLFRHRF